jgi:cysteine sulfinate desulfinase/cysteine desulfurase-like protein/rhodanese-related sulfurtransferase
MEIYLDANATTPVLPQARAAALALMADAFGNPSSIHGSGLKARAVLDEVRARARRVLGVPRGQVLFTSGATEGIQTAVLSALADLRRRRDAGAAIPARLLYGATEHKAVPEALRHWNTLLGLGLDIAAIPVGPDGRHDLAWLRAQAPAAGLVCTMAANNETGVVSDLDGIAAALAGSPALWLVDGVQALGKLDLRLAQRRIDYAPFSGHKLYAPKGIGMLYVREGAPFTPLLAGGGQEGALRSGTENMAGIAALGAVLAALEAGDVFADRARLEDHRNRLAAALEAAFPGVVFNAPFAHSLPTTLNFSVPGVTARMLQDLFDAAGIRVSGGSACGAARARPSDVLQAMGLPEWQTAAAVRLSFGAADATATIDEACARLRACGQALRATCHVPGTPGAPGAAADDTAATGPVTRFALEGACCYVVSDHASRRCVVIDPLPELAPRLAQWVSCRGYAPVAILGTHGDRAAARPLRQALPAATGAEDAIDAFGWPVGEAALVLGPHRLTPLTVPGQPEGSRAYLLADAGGPRMAFVGDALRHGVRTSDDLSPGTPTNMPTLQALAPVVGVDTLLLPRHDEEGLLATTSRAERAAIAAPAAPAGPAEGAGVELPPARLRDWLRMSPRPLVIDVREDFEAHAGRHAAALAAQSVPLSALLDAIPRWRDLAPEVPLVFVCRSGNRSAQAARAVRRLAHANAWSLAGGLALWPGEERREAAGVPSVSS